MADWRAVAVLPNLSTSDVFDGGEIALTSLADARVQAIVAKQPKLAEFLSRFTDAFGVKINPAVLIVRDDWFATMRTTTAIPSFRDILVVSVVPYARARTVVRRITNHICYSASFWLYPWMIAGELQHLPMSTPALSAFHVVEAFHGQSSPEVPELQLRTFDLDKVLFAALMKRWKRHYLRNRQILSEQQDSDHLPGGWRVAPGSGGQMIGAAAGQGAVYFR
ncbi:MAG: hypothetical protein QOF70_6293 [Acetobacteraceae bacterium]|nr:hypothetical protein [Acetobacteraceae bacterium]